MNTEISCRLFFFADGVRYQFLLFILKKGLTLVRFLGMVILLFVVSQGCSVRFMEGPFVFDEA